MRAICCNHHCPRFECRVAVSDSIDDAETERCSECGQLLVHESGLTFRDALWADTDSTFATFVVFEDGNPLEQKSGLDARTAYRELRELEVKYPGRRAPAVFAVDMDDPELGNFDSSRLFEHYAVIRPN